MPCVYTFVHLFMLVCTRVCVHIKAPAEVRGQLLLVNSLLKLCESQGSKLGHSPDLRQAPLRTEPSLQLKIKFFFCKSTPQLTRGKHYVHCASGRFHSLRLPGLPCHQKPSVGAAQFISQHE